jgi:hypothetical protein
MLYASTAMEVSTRRRPETAQRAGSRVKNASDLFFKELLTMQTQTKPETSYQSLESQIAVARAGLAYNSGARQHVIPAKPRYRPLVASVTEE